MGQPDKANTTMPPHSSNYHYRYVFPMRCRSLRSSCFHPDNTSPPDRFQPLFHSSISRALYTCNSHPYCLHLRWMYIPPDTYKTRYSQNIWGHIYTPYRNTRPDMYIAHYKPTCPQAHKYRTRRYCCNIPSGTRRGRPPDDRRPKCCRYSMNNHTQYRLRHSLYSNRYTPSRCRSMWRFRRWHR